LNQNLGSPDKPPIAAANMRNKSWENIKELKILNHQVGQWEERDAYSIYKIQPPLLY